MSKGHLMNDLNNQDLVGFCRKQAENLCMAVYVKLWHVFHLHPTSALCTGTLKLNGLEIQVRPFCAH